MATELQRRKLEKVFASFDVDGDGVVEEMDFTAMAQVWCETYGMITRSPGWQAIHGHAQKLWRDMRGSIGADGIKRVSLREWVSWVDEPDFAEFVETSAIPFSIAVFHVADSDHDGRITVDEMMAAQSKSGMAEEETRVVFAKLDTDEDGYVTAEEYTQAARDFYLSDDPEAPGNLIAGSL